VGRPGVVLWLGGEVEEVIKGHTYDITTPPTFKSVADVMRHHVPENVTVKIRLGIETAANGHTTSVVAHIVQMLNCSHL